MSRKSRLRKGPRLRRARNAAKERNERKHLTLAPALEIDTRRVIDAMDARERELGREMSEEEAQAFVIALLKGEIPYPV